MSRILDTLPERLTLARQQKMPHQDILLLPGLHPFLHHVPGP